MNDAPCIHYCAPSAALRTGVPADHCLIGRDAPHDCAAGCAAYDADELSAASLHPEERTRCEIWTRVMGYHRPVSAFNPGKQAEHAERRYFIDRPGDTGRAVGAGSPALGPAPT
jgi:hypothetical protein